MSEAVKHTPGPWRIKEGGNYGNTIEARTGEAADGCPRYSVICSFQAALPRGNHKYSVEDANAQANGRLIAAAPELLECLKDARKKLNDGDKIDLAYIDEVIAKAEGATS